jgi:hypothetical protein
VRGGWIGVDLDGTLAEYDGWKGPGIIGDPVPRMLERVKKWIEDGKNVRIVTARVSRGGHEREVAEAAIRRWCVRHVGRALPITNVKDFGMIELWDDRAVQVVPNKGERVDGKS